MSQEIETKVLEVDSNSIQEKMKALGAIKILDTRLTVDWFSPKGIVNNEHPWYLRVRSDSNGHSEITWKSLPMFVGNTRQSKEITFDVSDNQKTQELFIALGLEKYAHQEKDRMSWTCKDWRFDLDQYPDMPAYLEIEGTSEEHVQEALLLLDLSQHTAVSEGERILIEKRYGLHWNDMRF